LKSDDFEKITFELVHGRYEMLQENVNGFQREIEALREKNQKMNATHQRHEQIIYTMTQDLREANEKLTMAEVRGKLMDHQQSNILYSVLFCKLLKNFILPVAR